MDSNSLPTDIRSITRCSVDCFKRKLDKYLWTVPDEPQIPGFRAQRRADSNSIVDMSRYASAHHQPVVEVPGYSLTPCNRGCANSIAMAQWCQKIQQGNKVRSIIYIHIYIYIYIYILRQFVRGAHGPFLGALRWARFPCMQKSNLSYIPVSYLILLGIVSTSYFTNKCHGCKGYWTLQWGLNGSYPSVSPLNWFTQ